MAAKPNLRRRSSGVLLHPTSLPGPRGGDLGPEALKFIDFLADSGQSWWQVLPICPPDVGGSPYSSISAFAGSSSLVSMDLLAAEGLLKRAELGQPKPRALRAAFAAFSRRASREDRTHFEEYREREKGWLADHSLFCALKEETNGAMWIHWPEALRRRDSLELEKTRVRLVEEIRFEEFTQWIFARQWEAVGRHAAGRGIALIGDAPIYVSHDSVDCWAHQDLFFLDYLGEPSAVAGVPPDYFSKTGQRWGNPLYRWDEHQRTDFAWWVARLRAYAARFSVVRLDHFIGFRNYWEIPAVEKTAMTGRWVSAPGDDLFETVRREVPGLEIIAEDLGAITEPVVALRDRFGFPGMKIGQFSFVGKAEERPEHWQENYVGYTGTHDNDTSRGWFESDGTIEGRDPAQVAAEHAAFAHAAGDLSDGPAWAMARLVWRSRCRLAIAPMQDLLSLPAEARMNRPGTLRGNWRWRMEPGSLTASVAGRLGTMTGASGRAPEGS